MKEPARTTIKNKLMAAGMSEVEADSLLAIFLEEEAQLYIECMEAVEEDKKEKKEIIH